MKKAKKKSKTRNNNKVIEKSSPSLLKTLESRVKLESVKLKNMFKSLQRSTDTVDSSIETVKDEIKHGLEQLDNKLDNSDTANMIDIEIQLEFIKLKKMLKHMSVQELQKKLKALKENLEALEAKIKLEFNKLNAKLNIPGRTKKLKKDIELAYPKLKNKFKMPNFDTIKNSLNFEKPLTSLISFILSGPIALNMSATKIDNVKPSFEKASSSATRQLDSIDSRELSYEPLIDQIGKVTEANNMLETSVMDLEENQTELEDIFKRQDVYETKKLHVMTIDDEEGLRHIIVNKKLIEVIDEQDADYKLFGPLKEYLRDWNLKCRGLKHEYQSIIEQDTITERQLLISQDSNDVDLSLFGELYYVKSDTIDNLYIYIIKNTQKSINLSTELEDCIVMYEQDEQENGEPGDIVGYEYGKEKKIVFTPLAEFLEEQGMEGELPEECEYQDIVEYQQEINKVDEKRIALN